MTRVSDLDWRAEKNRKKGLRDSLDVRFSCGKCIIEMLDSEIQNIRRNISYLVLVIRVNWVSLRNVQARITWWTLVVITWTEGFQGDRCFSFSVICKFSTGTEQASDISLPVPSLDKLRQFDNLWQESHPAVKFIAELNWPCKQLKLHLVGQVTWKRQDWRRRMPETGRSGRKPSQLVILLNRDKSLGKKGSFIRYKTFLWFFPSFVSQ